MKAPRSGRPDTRSPRIEARQPADQMLGCKMFEPLIRRQKIEESEVVINVSEHKD